MAIRKKVVRKRKAVRKKTAKRKTPARKRKTTRVVKKRKTRKRKTVRKTAATSTRHNRSAHWKAYRELQERADKAWDKFRNDVRKNAKSDILIRDHNHLRLLLGECNYMARECMRMAAKGKKRRSR